MHQYDYRYLSFCFASFFQKLYNLKCYFLFNFFRFLMWKLKTCPTKQDLVYSMAVPVYALQLLKAVKKTERFATFHRLFCCFHLLTCLSWNKKRHSLTFTEISMKGLCSAASRTVHFDGRNDEKVPIQHKGNVSFKCNQTDLYYLLYT